MEIVHLTKDNFKTTIESGKKVLVDFWAAWCGPCKMLAPILEEVAAETNDDNVVIAKLDVDAEGDIAQEYSIMSIPTMIVFENGEVKQKSVGLVPKEKIAELLK